MSDSTPPAVTLVEVNAGFSFDEEPIDCVVVSLVHGKRRYDVVLRRDTPRAVVDIAHDPQQALSFTYQYIVHFRQPTTGAVDPIASPERTTDSRVIIVPGREAYQVMRLQMIAASRFAEVRQIAVEVRPRARPQNVATAQFDEGRREWGYQWVIDRDAATDYDYRVTVETDAGEIRRGPWQQSDHSVLLVSEHPALSRSVKALLVGKELASAGIVAAKVRFSYDGGAGQPPQEAEFEVAHGKPVLWTYWFSDGQPQAFTYQFTLVRADGTTTALEPVSSTNQVILHPIT